MCVIFYISYMDVTSFMYCWTIDNVLAVTMLDICINFV